MTQPDPINWINTILRNPETGKPFDLLPAEINFLEHAFMIDNEGRAVYPELVYSCPKKSGKTAFAAILILTATLLYGGFEPEAICAANDLEQASSRVFLAIAKIVKASPALRDRAKITQEKIVFSDIGAVITAITSDAAGAAGANPVISCGDELWGFTSESSRRLWDELVPPPTRKAAWRLVVTYAGFSGESTLLEELYRHGTSQPEIGPDLYAGNGQLTFWTCEPVAPWQDAKWLSQMRRSLRPNQYARMIENRWVSSESVFVEMPWWDACVNADMRPIMSDRSLPVWIGVDASVKRDSTAIVAVTSDGETVRLIQHRIFQPSQNDPLDFERTIEATVKEWCDRFSVVAVLFDPYQMQSTAQRLMKAGLPMHEFPQTVANLTAASTNLFELIKSGSITVYPDDAIRLAVSRAIAVEGSRGWKIAKEKQSHKIDVVVAMAQAAYGALHVARSNGDGWVEYYRRLAAEQGLDVAAIEAGFNALDCDFDPIRQPQHGWRFHDESQWINITMPSGHDAVAVNGQIYQPSRRIGADVLVDLPRDAAREVLRRTAFAACNADLVRDLGVLQCVQ